MPAHHWSLNDNILITLMYKLNIPCEKAQEITKISETSIKFKYLNCKFLESGGITGLPHCSKDHIYVWNMFC